MPDSGVLRGGGCRQVREKLNDLKLSNEAVLVREHAREEAYGKVQAPWFIRLPFAALCWTLDVVFNNRPIQRRVAAGSPTAPALRGQHTHVHRTGTKNTRASVPVSVWKRAAIASD